MKTLSELQQHQQLSAEQPPLVAQQQQQPLQKPRMQNYAETLGRAHSHPGVGGGHLPPAPGAGDPTIPPTGNSGPGLPPTSAPWTDPPLSSDIDQAALDYYDRHVQSRLDQLNQQHRSSHRASTRGGHSGSLSFSESEREREASFSRQRWPAKAPSETSDVLPVGGVRLSESKGREVQQSRSCMVVPGCMEVKVKR